MTLNKECVKVYSFFDIFFLSVRLDQSLGKISLFQASSGNESQHSSYRNITVSNYA